MRHTRKIINGYTDFGGIRIPPLPQFIVIEDRATGTPYVLTHTGEGENIILALSTNLPRREKSYYGPYAGPYLAPNVRLFINGGSLNIEYAQGIEVANQRVLTRRGNERIFIEILYSQENSTIDTPGITSSIFSV